jgi:hypothetical protein
LNEYKKMFKTARRLQSSEELWRRIAAESDLSTALRRDATRAISPLRAAAVLALAAGLVGLLFQQTHQQKEEAAAAAAMGTAGALDLVDPDLLAWGSKLGDFDWKSDQGFPFADTASGDDWFGTAGATNGEEGDWL